MGLARGGETTNIFGQLVSGNYFSVLEVQPTLGRGFVASEDAAKNAHPVVVLSHRFWKKLGSDPQIVGTVLILNGRTFTVVDVAPASFTGTEVTVAPDLWVPMAMHDWDAGQRLVSEPARAAPECVWPPQARRACELGAG